jgi:poly(3-hydroxybutyrate) depolymerase
MNADRTLHVDAAVFHYSLALLLLFSMGLLSACGTDRSISSPESPPDPYSENSIVLQASGCGNTEMTSGTYTMPHGGLTRTFRVHVPAGYDADTPTRLVLIFHGWGGDENEFLNDRTVIAQADARGYILVAPRGLGSGDPDYENNSWSFSGSTTGLDGDGQAICDPKITPDYTYPSCSEVAANSCSWTHCQADDVDFAVALVEHIETNLCVDRNNVFATGGSNGGMFTWELGQNSRSAPTFRAIAPLIGLPHRAYLDPPGKSDDMPVIVITGLRDKVVPPGAWDDPSFTTTSNFRDRYYYTGATAITRSWAGAQGCATSGKEIRFEDGYRKADCRTYCSGDPGWPRVLDCRANMGHVYNLSWSWNLIMDFFDEHSMALTP